MNSSNSLAPTLDAFRRNMMATQERIVEIFTTQLGTLPLTRRPAAAPALFPDGIDERLDIFSMFYWDMSQWPLSGFGIPDDIAPVTTLDGLIEILPRILKADAERLESVNPPESDEGRNEYLDALYKLVMDKATADNQPPSLPAEYESFLKLARSVENPDLFNHAICEVGLFDYEFDTLAPDLEDLDHFVGWEASAGFVLGMAHESTCYFIYNCNTNKDAKEDEKEWAWRVSFGTAPCTWLRDSYLGDFEGFLDFYANIYIMDSIPEQVSVKIGNLQRSLGQYIPWH